MGPMSIPNHNIIIRNNNDQNADSKSISSSVPSIPEDTSQGSNDINARSNLLAEIRKGKELRKVQQQEKDRFMMEAAVNEGKKIGPGGISVNVADILNTRRMFLKDSSDEETTELSDEDWDDDNVR